MLPACAALKAAAKGILGNLKARPDGSTAAASSSAAAPGLEGASCPRMEDIQPRFPVEKIVNEYDLGRRFFMMVFPQHFTNGKGGLDEADPTLTEAEFLDHAAHWTLSKQSPRSINPQKSRTITPHLSINHSNSNTQILISQ